MIADPERYANEYELDAKASIDSKRESGSVSIVAMRLWLRAAHAVVELTGPADGNGKTFGSDGNVSLWLHESDLALGNALLNRISSENAKLREQIHWLKKGDILHVLTDQEYIDQCERERLMQVSIDALDKENDRLRELVSDMGKMLTLASWTSVESDEQSSQCIYRAEELGIEVPS